jgi:imidazolonepropionase-like amidohydrolase
MKLLTGCTVIDGTGAAALTGASILIDGARIVQVGLSTRVSGPPDAKVVRLDGKTVIPGIIDVHVHMCGLSVRRGDEALAASETACTVGALENARKALLNGVTTMRDVGGPFMTNVKVRNLIEKGYAIGPRLSACGHPLAMTGGHGVGMSLEVDSPDEARKAARRMRKEGADCIKLMANGLSMEAPELSAEEMRAAVEVAHDHGMKVACHASVWRAVDNAIQAGVDTIDHGYTLNEDFVERMLKQGTILVPTYGTVQMVGKCGEADPTWAPSLPVIRHRIRLATNSFALAYKAGVKFALGTDGSNRPLLYVGEVLEEFKAFAQIGLTPLESIRAGTLNGAEAMGWQDRVGSIEAGKLADLVVLNRDPLKDIGALGDIDSVFKGGERVVSNGHIVGPLV